MLVPRLNYVDVLLQLKCDCFFFEFQYLYQRIFNKNLNLNMFNSFRKTINLQIMHRCSCQDQALTLLQPMRESHEIVLVLKKSTRAMHFNSQISECKIWSPWMEAKNCVNVKELLQLLTQDSIAVSVFVFLNQNQKQIQMTI